MKQIKRRMRRMGVDHLKVVLTYIANSTQRRDPALTRQRIGAAFGCSKSAAQNWVDALERLGWLTRYRRGWNALEVTAAGRAALRKP